MYKNIYHLKKFVPTISKASNFDDVEETIRQTAQIFIQPYIGESCFSSLSSVSIQYAEFDATNSKITIREPTEQNEKIKFIAARNIAASLAHYYSFVAIGQNNVQITPTTAKTSQTQNTENLSISEIKHRQQNILKIADNLLDAALQVITTNSTIFTDFAPTFEPSKLFTNSTEFEKYQFFKGFRAFQIFTKYIKTAEDDFLQSLFTASQLVKIYTPETEAEKQKTEIVKKYIINIAIYNALPFLNCIIDEEGIKILSSSDANDTRQHIQNNYLARVEKMREVAQQNAARYKAILTTTSTTAATGRNQQTIKTGTSILF